MTEKTFLWVDEAEGGGLLGKPRAPGFDGISPDKRGHSSLPAGAWRTLVPWLQDTWCYPDRFESQPFVFSGTRCSLQVQVQQFFVLLHVVLLFFG